MEEQLSRETLRVDEAARVLGIGRSLCCELIRTGRLPALRLGRRLVVPRHALERLLQNPERSKEEG